MSPAALPAAFYCRISDDAKVGCLVFTARSRRAAVSRSSAAGPKIEQSVDNNVPVHFGGASTRVPAVLWDLAAGSASYLDTARRD